jgi:serine/threonine protein kinase
MSPEGMIEHLYGMKTDVWAFGIIIFELLHGKTPFSYCSSEYELKRAVVTSISYHTLRADLSAEIKQLVLKCLVVDHVHRPDAIALKSDPVLFSLLRPIIN